MIAFISTFDPFYSDLFVIYSSCPFRNLELRYASGMQILKVINIRIRISKHFINTYSHLPLNY